MHAPALLSRNIALQLCALSVLLLLPRIAYQAWSISAFAAALIAWRTWLAVKSSLYKPRRRVLLPLAALGFTLIVVTYGNPLGRQPGLALLSFLLPLKLLEARNVRDLRSALLLSFFLIAGLFLNGQSLLLAICATCATWLTLATTACVQRPALTLPAAFKLTGGLLLAGLPLMLALFFLFPRINGPLWSLPLDGQSARTGLSEQMRSGSISDLIQSSDVAFRAEFQGPIPAVAERYWRGPVLSQFDGEVWRPETLETPFVRPQAPRQADRSLARNWHYTLTLEPNTLRWVLALDYPVQAERQTTSYIWRADHALMQPNPNGQRSRHTLHSQPDYIVGTDESVERLAQLRQLPAGFNPRTLAAGAEIAQQHAQPAARLAAALALMRRAGLQYTLTPALGGRDSTDDFLFKTRQGFCEHFAAALVMLSRAAGLSARVVTGYQGGDINPVDGSLIVRQYDAHAWTEVWLPERGWQRVDPTAASFPQRLNDNGLAASLGNTSALPFMARRDMSWLVALRYRQEALTNAWNQWVLGYNNERQLALMQQLGLPDADWRTLVGGMAAAASLWIGLILWRQHRQSRIKHRTDPVEKIWLRFCRHTAHLSPRQPWECASHYCQRLAQLRPQHAAALQTFSTDYAQLRFSVEASTAHTKNDPASHAALVEFHLHSRRLSQALKRAPSSPQPTPTP